MGVLRLVVPVLLLLLLVVQSCEPAPFETSRVSLQLLEQGELTQAAGPRPLLQHLQPQNPRSSFSLLHWIASLFPRRKTTAEPSDQLEKSAGSRSSSVDLNPRSLDSQRTAVPSHLQGLLSSNAAAEPVGGLVAAAAAVASASSAIHMNSREEYEYCIRHQKGKLSNYLCS